MRTEKAFGIICLVGILFKLLHWKGADSILIISLSILSLLYFPLSFYFFSYKGIKNQNLVLSIIAGLFLSILPLGVMFKLMYWRGATTFLTIGIPAALTLFIIVYYLPNRHEHLVNYNRQLRWRIVVWSGLALALYFTPMATQLKIQHWDDAELARLKHRSFSNPQNAAYKQELEAYRTKKENK